MAEAEPLPHGDNATSLIGVELDLDAAATGLKRRERDGLSGYKPGTLSTLSAADEQDGVLSRRQWSSELHAAYDDRPQPAVGESRSLSVLWNKRAPSKGRRVLVCTNAVPAAQDQDWARAEAELRLVQSAASDLWDGNTIVDGEHFVWCAVDGVTDLAGGGFVSR
eukprot:gene36816-45434_t